MTDAQIRQQIMAQSISTLNCAFEWILTINYYNMSAETRKAIDEANDAVKKAMYAVKAELKQIS